MHPESKFPHQVTDTPPPRWEIDLYCRYLTGKPANGNSQALFARAVELGIAPLDARGEKALRFLVNHEWSIGCVDAALGVFLPRHSLRGRMILAFAILETSPIYFEVFCPRPFSRIHALVLAFQGTLEMVKAVFGRILLGLH